MNKPEGFSLIELLIVVAIILIVAAIAIPNLLRARQQANETSGAASVRTITNAEITYAATYPDVGFTCTISDLGPYTTAPSPTAAGLIDAVLSTGRKSGYTFTLSNCASSPPSQRVSVFGVPNGGAGVRKFCSDESGVLRFDPGAGNCTATSSPLQ